MRWSSTLLLGLVGCASARRADPAPTTRPDPAANSRPDPSPSSRPFTASTEPPSLSGQVVVEEGETGPSSPELAPYIRQIPIVRVTELADYDDAHTMASYDLAVFADGMLFFEGVSCPGPAALQQRRLTPAQVQALRARLEAGCPGLRSPPGRCTHSVTFRVACGLDPPTSAETDLCGHDRGGRQILLLARDVAKLVDADPWIRATEGRGCMRGLSRVGREIDRTIAPTPWKKYAPAGTPGR